MTDNIHKFLYTFSKDFIGEDSLNKYMDRNKILSLESSTPFPVRLITGVKNFKQYNRHHNLNKEEIIHDKPMYKLPIIYHNLNKLKDIAHKINKNSKLPIGILMLNNDIFKSTKSDTLDFQDYLKLTLAKKQLKFIRHTFGDINLSPTTLVPLKLICKRKKCVFIDDPLLQEYLNLIELPKASVDANTMIPLGILLVMKKLYY